tara:strand:- start:252 stop:2054 length:1803 start_codon:yes stop_codon:yes gene_type:complete
MAFAIDTYTGNNSTTSFSVTFPYIEQAHVIVSLDGVTKTITTDYTFTNASTITFTTAPATGVVIKFTRSSNRTTRLVDYQDGSTLTEATLDQDGNQSFFMAQEAIDVTENSLNKNAQDLFDAQNKRIINVATPTSNNDAVNKTYVDAVAGSATAAAASETAAANSATAAQNAQAAAEAALDTFDDDFLGAKSSDPTLDNDGNALTDGALYYNTTDNRMKVYDLGTTAWLFISPTSTEQTKINSVADNINAVSTVSTNLTDINAFENTYKISATAPSSPVEGTLWFDTTADIMKVYDGSSFINAGSSVNGTSGRFKYIATANQTTFTGASHSDTGGAVLSYDAGFINVFKNGVHLDPSDYTATDGNNVVLDVGCSVNDEIYVLTFGTFSLASFSATAVTSDTLAVARGGTGKTTSDLTGNQGKALVVNSAQNGFDLSTTSSAEVYGFETYYNGSTLVKTVTVQSVGGSNKYFIDGVQQDTLELYEGNTYVFNHPSAHPFRFSTDSGNSNAYTTGVTVNSSTQVTIVVATGAPTLYYYCSSHSGMGGQANTPVPAVNSVRVITTNQGADNISQSQYANFDESLFSASGFVFSISNGELIATI